VSEETRGMLLGAVAVVLFGLTLPATRFIVPWFDPIFIGLGRAVVAAILALFLLVLTRQKLPNRSQTYRLFIIALGVVVGFPVLSAWAMQSVPASHGGVVLGILPLATAIAGVIISSEKPSVGFWLSGLVGSALVVAYALFQGVGSFQVGDYALLGAIFSAAIGYAVGGQLSKEIGGWQVICWALVFALPFIFIPAWLQAPDLSVSLPLSVWLSFLYLALVSQLIGFFLWNKGLAIGGVARVSQVQLIQPFVTIVASALLINEAIEMSTFIFSLLVVVTVAIGKRMPILTKE